MMHYQVIDYGPGYSPSYGMGASRYCPPPREWCSSLARCLDPSNPDTPCTSAAAPSPYSTTTGQDTSAVTATTRARTCNWAGSTSTR